MSIHTIQWVGNRIKLIDQTQLPLRFRYIYCNDIKTLYTAIRHLKVRGAPAIGIAGALGVCLFATKFKGHDYKKFMKGLKRTIGYLGSSRPTAVNLFWGLNRLLSIAQANSEKSVRQIKALLLKEAECIIQEDRDICRKMGELGARLIKNKSSILTICNAGALATADFGTALGVMYEAKLQGKKIKVYSCETRPLLQGARLTTWELQKNKIDVTLICDSMAATLMQQGKIDMVITGADRIANNGDSANKIGTYSLAVLASFHKIPFYIAAPISTFDFSLSSGKKIPIELRDPNEITELFFKKRLAPKGVHVYNPAFDVTPNSLITGIITEKGIIKKPFSDLSSRLQ